MDFKITEEKVKEVAERYGLTAKKVNNKEEAGFVIGDKSIEVEELFNLLFETGSIEETIFAKYRSPEMKIEKRKSKIYLKNIEQYQNFYNPGVA